jgi:hypothetical protein
MRINFLFLLLLASFACGAQSYVFVGSFRIGDGPCWNQSPAPPTYTAQEAAALIFGGSPSDYAISVNSNTTNPATITHTAYLDGYANTQYFSTPAAENFKSGSVYTYPSFSAYVKDNSDGNTLTGNCNYTTGTVRTNYVWRLCPAPTITCPQNQTANTSPTSCDAVVAYNANISGATSVSYAFSGATTGGGSGTGSGSRFNKGVTTVTLTANSSCGSATCSFTVTVTDNQVPHLVVIPSSPVSINQLGRGTTYSNAKLNGGTNSLLVNPGASVTFTANWNSYYAGGAGCPGCITQHHVGINGVFSDCHGAGFGSGSINQTFSAPTTPGVYYITQTATWWYYCGQFGIPANSNDPNEAIAVLVVAGSNSNGCPGNITVNAATGACSANVTYLTPAAIDNCPGSAVTQTAGNASGSSFNVGTTTNTFVVTDASNLTNTCSFDVTVVDNQAPVITCPAAQTVDCAGDVPAPAPTTVSASDNCAVQSVTWEGDVISNQTCANRYTITRTYKATDIHTNSSTCTQTITVNDQTAPTGTQYAGVQGINSCLPTATSVAAFDATNAAAGYSDNCGGVVTATQDGPTDIQGTNCSWTATYYYHVSDACGNTLGNQSYTNSGGDQTAPTARCKPATVTLAGGSASITPSDVDNGSDDNCGDPVTLVSVSPSTFTCNDAGQDVAVTLTVRDACGNQSTCGTTVHVNGVVPTCSITSAPTTGTYTDGNVRHIYLGYGNGKTVLTATGSGGGPFTYSWSGASGLVCNNVNCSSVTFTPTAGGNYTITATVTNSNGCTSTCTIVICVLDIRVPNQPGYVYICHAPPGNPTNTQTLAVGTSAVASHLSNHSGDKLGQCGQVCGAGAKMTGNSVLGDQVKVYPNPNNGAFTIELPYIEDQATITVTDVAGKTIAHRTVKDGDANRQIFNLGDAARGIYFVEVSLNGQRFRTKLTIQ